MGGRTIRFVVEFWIIWLIFLQHIVDSGEQHSGNGNDCFLVSPTLFKGEISITDLGKLLSPNRIKSALYEQRLDVASGPADPGGSLLPGTFIVLRRKPSLGAKVL